MRKLFIITILTFGISFSGTAQISNCTSSDIHNMKKNTMYVVMKGATVTTNVKYTKVEGDSVVNVNKADMTSNIDTEYNKAIRWAMQNIWKHGKFEFITEEDFEEKRMRNNTFFITTVKQKTDDKEPVFLNLLAIVKGGTKYKKVEKMPIVSAIPLSYYSVSDQYYIYKIPALLSFLQNYVDYVFDNYPVDEKKMMKELNSKSKEIKHGVLYVLQDDLTEKVYDVMDIEKYYKGEVMIVDQGEIDKAIKRRDSNILFLHKVGPEGTAKTGICHKYIFSASGELLYLDEHNISKSSPEGFLESDFKQINK